MIAWATDNMTTSASVTLRAAFPAPSDDLSASRDRAAYERHELRVAAVYLVGLE